MRIISSLLFLSDLKKSDTELEAESYASVKLAHPLKPTRSRTPTTMVLNVRFMKIPFV